MSTTSQDIERNRAGRRQVPERERPGTGENRWKQVALAVLGGLLLVRGLGRRSLRGILTALVGGWMVARAVRGMTRSGGSVGTDARTASQRGDSTGDGVDVHRSITVGKPAEELYEMWLDPEQFSQVMGHFATVTAAGEDRQRWTVHGPGGHDVTWETRTVEAERGERLRWKTTEDALVPNEGSVRFHELPGDRGTEVSLSLSFDPPGGSLTNAALKRFDMAPELLASKALERFKSLAESGEIPSLAGNPSARGRGDLL